MHNPNVRKADLFAALRKMWESFPDPKLIIDDLEQYQPAYLALNAGHAYHPERSDIALRVNRIYRAGRPTSIYPFVLKLLRSWELEQITEGATCKALDAIESFLFRRAVTGIEPTGLHAVFKGLWQELTAGSPTLTFEEALAPGRICAAIRAKPTITWPNDDDFGHAIKTGELYRRKIVGYALREYEIGLKGESPSDAHQAEHIAPQIATGTWQTHIPQEYEKLVHTWGNLLPLTPTSNQSAGQNDFSSKRKTYADSISRLSP